MKRIDISTALYRNAYTMVDDDDFENLSLHVWKMSEHGYAIGGYNKENKKYTLIHRFIMGAKKGEVVDHINHNRLDNRKENLRICSHGQNEMNKKKRIGTTSRYKGVSKNKNKWIAFIKADKETIYLGVFIKEVDAAKTYNLAAIKYHGAFAYLNAIPIDI